MLAIKCLQNDSHPGEVSEQNYDNFRFIIIWQSENRFNRFLDYDKVWLALKIMYLCRLIAKIIIYVDNYYVFQPVISMAPILKIGHIGNLVNKDDVSIG